MPECVFCQIGEGRMATKTRYEDEDFIAFDDINPKAPVHILVIPKKHYGSVAVLEGSDSDMVGKLIIIANKVAKKVGIDENGFRLIFNSGTDAGMDMDHLHVHLLGGHKLKDIP